MWDGPPKPCATCRATGRWRPATAEGRTLGERLAAARGDPARAVLEGFHPLKHALRFGARIETLYVADRAAVERLAVELAPDIAERLVGAAAEIDADELARLAPAAARTGVLAVARRPVVDVAGLVADPGPAPVVLLAEPARLGNVGAAVRVAAAAGAAGVLTTGRHDPWHAAALRGSAGLHFALPVARVEERFPVGGRPLVALDPDGEPLGPGAIPARAILAFGSERAGLGPDHRARAERRLAIPMRTGVSSLNLATAVAVALYVGRTW